MYYEPPLFGGAGAIRMITMHEKLWEGVELKISNAEFFLDQMGIASAVGADFDEYRLPRCAQTNYGTRWQRSFYAHLDAFLAMGRSISEIINCCFGADLGLAMKSWFNCLDAAEKSRRRMFSKQFQADHKAFAKLPLTNARNITFHRTGFANVTVTISGHFGVTYTGGPVRPVPSTETKPIAPIDDPGRSSSSVVTHTAAASY
jgi:hypothetical protein